MRRVALVLASLLVLLFTLAACGDAVPTVTPTPTFVAQPTDMPATPAPANTVTTQPGATPMESAATVEAIEAVIQPSDATHVAVTLKGYLPNPCTKITNVAQQRSGNTFTITLTTLREAGAACIEMISPFEQPVTLDVTGLPSGTYTVTSGGISATFDLK